MCVFGIGGEENEEGAEKHFRQRKHLNAPIVLGHSEPEMREITQSIQICTLYREFTFYSICNIQPLKYCIWGIGVISIIS